MIGRNFEYSTCWRQSQCLMSKLISRNGDTSPTKLDQHLYAPFPRNFSPPLKFILKKYNLHTINAI